MECECLVLKKIEGVLHPSGRDYACMECGLIHEAKPAPVIVEFGLPEGKNAQEQSQANQDAFHCFLHINCLDTQSRRPIVLLSTTGPKSRIPYMSLPILIVALISLAYFSDRFVRSFRRL